MYRFKTGGGEDEADGHGETWDSRGMLVRSGGMGGVAVAVTVAVAVVPWYGTS